ncbi:MAG: hypothetical protein NTZ48_04095, partial [Candidatus Omnitrophica bacterium]|nr:hypothetical protein [Candidatus Omnitrophota bacterium]
QSSDRWALEAFAGTQEVGLYAVLFQLGYTPIIMATGLAMTLIAPVLFQRSGDASDHARNQNVHRLVWSITLSGLLLTLTGFLLAFGLHDVIFRYLVAMKYRSASHFLPWLICAGGMFAAGQMLSLKLVSEMRSLSLVRAKIITALFGIGLNFCGAAAAGLKGIVAANVAFGSIYLLWMIILAIRTPGAFVKAESSKCESNNENTTKISLI